VQEAYLRAWRALPEFSTESKLSTWLVCIAAPSGCWRARRCARCDRIVAKVLARAGAEGLWRDADPA
jgi:DNA-directed RNA polymerase specialized sigma24 family protein